MHLKEDTLFDLNPWDQGLKKCCPIASTSSDLCSNKFEGTASNHSGGNILQETRQTDKRTTDFGTKLINTLFSKVKAPAGIVNSFYASMCTRGNCQQMATPRECKCCREIRSVVLKMEDYEVVALPLQCITEYPGFLSVCLDQYVLETAYYQYRQQYGERHGDDENK